MKPYCRVCSFGIICHWMRQTSILSTDFPITGEGLWDGKTLDGVVVLTWLRYHLYGRYLPGPGKYPSCKHLFAMARNNPRSRKDGSLAYIRSEPVNPRGFWD
ncbi:hypothetical protein EVAR_16185_1 [Eumeta japonica]|uniref:Uncharacterized protein n=1 Tax=Eumeta variegata TaxID=151549 RepID=A0A4C1WAV5_EUMVA|nr:hypothetical protein EVAR_16185_1 [Eumeta japonica]